MNNKWINAALLACLAMGTVILVVCAYILFEALWSAS